MNNTAYKRATFALNAGKTEKAWILTNKAIKEYALEQARGEEEKKKKVSTTYSTSVSALLGNTAVFRPLKADTPILCLFLALRAFIFALFEAYPQALEDILLLSQYENDSTEATTTDEAGEGGKEAAKHASSTSEPSHPSAAPASTLSGSMTSTKWITHIAKALVAGYDPNTTVKNEKDALPPAGVLRSTNPGRSTMPGRSTPTGPASFSTAEREAILHYVLHALRKFPPQLTSGGVPTWIRTPATTTFLTGGEGTTVVDVGPHSIVPLELLRAIAKVQEEGLEEDLKKAQTLHQLEKLWSFCVRVGDYDAAFRTGSRLVRSTGWRKYRVWTLQMLIASLPPPHETFCSPFSPSFRTATTSSTTFLLDCPVEAEDGEEIDVSLLPSTALTLRLASAMLEQILPTSLPHQEELLSLSSTASSKEMSTTTTTALRGGSVDPPTTTGIAPALAEVFVEVWLRRLYEMEDGDPETMESEKKLLTFLCSGRGGLLGAPTRRLEILVRVLLLLKNARRHIRRRWERVNAPSLPSPSVPRTQEAKETPASAKDQHPSPMEDTTESTAATLRRRQHQEQDLRAAVRYAGLANAVAKALWTEEDPNNWTFFELYIRSLEELGQGTAALHRLRQEGAGRVPLTDGAEPPPAAIPSSLSPPLSGPASVPYTVLPSSSSSTSKVSQDPYSTPPAEPTKGEVEKPDIADEEVEMEDGEEKKKKRRRRRKNHAKADEKCEEVGGVMPDDVASFLPLVVEGISVCEVMPPADSAQGRNQNQKKTPNNKKADARCGMATGTPSLTQDTPPTAMYRRVYTVGQADTTLHDALQLARALQQGSWRHPAALSDSTSTSSPPPPSEWEHMLKEVPKKTGKNAKGVGPSSSSTMSNTHVDPVTCPSNPPPFFQRGPFLAELVLLRRQLLFLSSSLSSSSSGSASSTCFLKGTVPRTIQEKRAQCHELAGLLEEKVLAYASRFYALPSCLLDIGPFLTPTSAAALYQWGVLPSTPPTTGASKPSKPHGAAGGTTTTKNGPWHLFPRTPNDHRRAILGISSCIAIWGGAAAETEVATTHHEEETKTEADDLTCGLNDVSRAWWMQKEEDVFASLLPLRFSTMTTTIGRRRVPLSLMEPLTEGCLRAAAMPGGATGAAGGSTSSASGTKGTPKGGEDIAGGYLLCAANIALYALHQSQLPHGQKTTTATDTDTDENEETCVRALVHRVLLALYAYPFAEQHPSLVMFRVGLSSSVCRLWDARGIQLLGLKSVQHDTMAHVGFWSTLPGLPFAQLSCREGNEGAGGDEEVHPWKSHSDGVGKWLKETGYHYGALVSDLGAAREQLAKRGNWPAMASMERFGHLQQHSIHRFIFSRLLQTFAELTMCTHREEVLRCLVLEREGLRWLHQAMVMEHAVPTPTPFSVWEDTQPLSHQEASTTADIASTPFPAGTSEEGQKEAAPPVLPSLLDNTDWKAMGAMIFTPMKDNDLFMALSRQLFSRVPSSLHALYYSPYGVPLLYTLLFIADLGRLAEMQGSFTETDTEMERKKATGSGGGGGRGRKGDLTTTTVVEERETIEESRTAWRFLTPLEPKTPPLEAATSTTKMEHEGRRNDTVVDASQEEGSHHHPHRRVPFFLPFLWSGAADSRRHSVHHHHHVASATAGATPFSCEISPIPVYAPGLSHGIAPLLWEWISQGLEPLSLTPPTTTTTIFASSHNTFYFSVTKAGVVSEAHRSASIQLFASFCEQLIFAEGESRNHTSTSSEAAAETFESFLFPAVTVLLTVFRICKAWEKVTVTANCGNTEEEGEEKEKDEEPTENTPPFSGTTSATSLLLPRSFSATASTQTSVPVDNLPVSTWAKTLANTLIQARNRYQTEEWTAGTLPSWKEMEVDTSLRPQGYRTSGSPGTMSLTRGEVALRQLVEKKKSILLSFLEKSITEAESLVTS